MKLKGKEPSFLTLHPSLLHALEVTDRVFRAVTGKHAVVTGLQEEGHSEESRHYGRENDVRCRAFDVRIRDFQPSQLESILKELRVRLPSVEFDVVLESSHLHIEVDEK